jgi:hypothetical protein
MSTATSRIPILVTSEQKLSITKKAKKANLSVGEYIRQAAVAYDPKANTEELSFILDQIKNTSEQTLAALDKTIRSVKLSQNRINKVEQVAQQRKKKVKH